MENRITPGEWNVQVAERDSSGRACYRVYTYIRVTDKQLKANAKLIAAAPDLLAALKRCQRVLDIAPIIGKEDLLNQVNEAIKKATT